MSVEIDLRHRLGAFRLDVSVTTRSRLTALFGESGSGKTSLINLVAGLLRPDEGRIAVDGTVFVDTARGLFRPPHRRHVGYVFQDARLFPHFSVRGNLRYGQWLAGGRGRRTDFDRIVALLGIDHLLARRPALLSGGERQRVAIGRALLSAPRLLLMDEPLAALDEARKAEIIPYIEALRDEAGIPILYVSHSPAEVLRLSAEMIVLERGRMVDRGPPADVMRRLDRLPVGADLEPGRALDARFAGQDEAFGLTILAVGRHRIFVPRMDGAVIGDPARLRIRARDVLVSVQPPEGLSALNVLPATVVRLTPHDRSALDVLLDCEGQEILARITRRSAARMNLADGRPVHAVLKAVSFDRQWYSGGLPATLET